MKKILLSLAMVICSAHLIFAQELVFNPELKLYEYISIKDFQGEIPAKINFFEKNMKVLSYIDISKDSTSVKGENFITKIIFGSAMEVHYITTIDFKQNKYRLLLNNFRIKDVRYGTVAIETLSKGSQKRWVGFINSELPRIIANLEKVDAW